MKYPKLGIMDTWK